MWTTLKCYDKVYKKKKYKKVTMSELTKVCVDCKEEHPLDNFYVAYKGYKRIQCKDCFKKRNKKSRDSRPEYSKHYYDTHKEYRAKIMKQNYERRKAKKKLETIRQQGENESGM